jgi:hypothetical protein
MSCAELSMYFDDHLNCLERELQDKYKSLSRDIEDIYQTQVDLQELNKKLKEREKVVEQLDNLDWARLNNALLKLNYQDQKACFQHYYKQFNTAAFLIHGPERHGHKWLLEKLLRFKQPADKMNRIKAFSYTKAGLWNALTQALQLAENLPPERIIDQIYQRWETRNVYLIFDAIDNFDPEDLNGFLLEFWGRLADRIGIRSPDESEYRLLVFLLDYRNQHDTHGATFIAPYSRNWQPHSVVKVPFIKLFSEKLLMDWIDVIWDYHQIYDFRAVKSQSVRDILERSQGIPELTLGQISFMCGFNWYEKVDNGDRFNLYW